MPRPGERKILLSTGKIGGRSGMRGLRAPESRLAGTILAQERRNGQKLRNKERLSEKDGRGECAESAAL